MLLKVAQTTLGLFIFAMTRQIKQRLIAIFTGIVVLYLFTFFPYFGFFRKIIEFIELKAYDIDIRFIRGESKPADDIIIVGIDDASFNQLGVFPWPRDFHAKLVKILKKYKAKIIAFDIDFSTPSKNDFIFADEIKNAGNVILVNTITIVNDKNFSLSTINYPVKVLKDNSLSSGFANIYTDQDGVIRNYILKTMHQDKIQNSFATEIFSRYSGVKDEDLFKKILQKNKESILINYCGTARTFKTISYWEVLREKFHSDFFENKIALVGATSDILHDIFYTPFGHISGVEIQANVINTISKYDFLYKVSESANKIIVCIIGLFAIILVVSLSPLVSLITIFILVVIAEMLFSYIFLYHNLWIDTITPVVSTFFVYSGATAVRYFTEGKEKKRIKNIFSRYVASSVVDEILKEPDSVALSGKRVSVAVLFSDIRGFTSLTEKLMPEDVVEILNEYLNEMIKVILEHNGTIDKFIGDAILAVFSVPFPKEDDDYRAIQTAIKMRERLNVLKMKWKAEGKELLNIGIGLDYGEVIAGSIGSKDRLEYTVIGDVVNTASRLQNLTKELHKDIIISEKIYEKVKDKVNVEPIGEYSLRGKIEPVYIYELLGLK